MFSLLTSVIGYIATVPGKYWKRYIGQHILFHIYRAALHQIDCKIWVGLSHYNRNKINKFILTFHKFIFFYHKWLMKENIVFIKNYLYLNYILNLLCTFLQNVIYSDQNSYTVCCNSLIDNMKHNSVYYKQNLEI